MQGSSIQTTSTMSLSTNPSSAGIFVTRTVLVALALRDDNLVATGEEIPSYGGQFVFSERSLQTWHGRGAALLHVLRLRRRLPRLRSDFGGRADGAVCQDGESDEEGAVVGDSLFDAAAAGGSGSLSRVRMVASRSERC